MADILYHDECQLLSYGESRQRGKWITLRLSDTEGDPLVNFRGLDKHGSGHSPILHVTVAIGDIIGSSEPQAETLYGQAARFLHQCDFWYRPAVWRAIGTDEEFLAWIRKQECAMSGGDTACSGDVVAAHVRRIADGAGTGIKPEYSAIPLCDGHHRAQHQHGESELGGKEQFDRARIYWLKKWCWETLKQTLGYDHWNEVPPPKLMEWAVENEVSHLVPPGYASYLPATGS